MFFKLFLALIFSLQLFASELVYSTYYIDGDDINISSLIPSADSDARLFNFPKSKQTKRIKSKLLMQMLAEHGYKGYSTKHRYIKFIKKSPIDLTFIEQEIIKEYKSKYHEIDIQKIMIRPRGYITSLPDEYKVYFKKRDYLSSKGIISIKGLSERKKIFFDYQIIARVPIYVARHDIKRRVALSLINTTKKIVILEKFKAKPVQKIGRNSIQTKRNIKKGTIITDRNSDGYSIVRKNAMVSANLQNGNIFINFTAKALQDGKLNDIITIQKTNGKKFKAIVIGKNKVEIR